MLRYFGGSTGSGLGLLNSGPILAIVVIRFVSPLTDAVPP